MRGLGSQTPPKRRSTNTSREKKLAFRAARGPESLCKGKAIIISKPRKEEPYEFIEYVH